MQLYIGNKTYSSWSMRPWVLMRAKDIAFEEVFVPFDSFNDSSDFKQTMAAIHPMASVPVLMAEGLVMGDSLAITDYLADAYPMAGIWPKERLIRAKARELVAMMHSGFGALRSHCLMNIGADLTEVGQELYQKHDRLRRDIARLEAVLAPHLDDGFLCGAFSAADAFYAPVMTRIETYGLPVSQSLASYQQRLLTHEAVRAWYDLALAENIFLDFEEPYRSRPA